jgi:hypothetical protein
MRNYGCVSRKHHLRTIFHQIPDQISINNMGEVKIEFQENNNGLHFHADRRSLWEYFSMSVISE